MALAQTPDGLLAAALADDPSRPLLTFYDDSSGERVELSVATVANWVAKTANMLQDGLAMQPGERAALLLPGHWQTAVWLLACWSAGVVAVPAGDPASADVVVAGPESLEGAVATRPPALVAVSLRTLGGPVESLPEGAVDYAEVLGYPDTFSAYEPITADTVVLEVEGRSWSGGELVDEARRRGEAWALTSSDRVLLTGDLGTTGSVIAGLLAPLACGAGVVLCRHVDEAQLPDRMAAERVTAVADEAPPPGMTVRRLWVPS